MAEYSRMAHGSYTVSGGTLGVSAPNVKVIQLPFKPDYVEIFNLTQAITPAQHGIPFAKWDSSVTPVTVSSVQYDTIAEIFNATPVLTTDSVRVGGGISTFSAGQLLQFGPTLNISGITKANPAVVTTTAAHGLASGDVVQFQGLYQSSTTGMPQIAGILFTVTVTGSTTFTIPWNTNQSSYTALSGSPSNCTVKKVLYPYIYFPGESVISEITLGSTTTVKTTSAHNFRIGQEVAFRIPSQYGSVEFNSLPNNLTPGAPAYGYVIDTTDYNTVVVNISSSSYTAFTNNVTVANTPGLSFPQIVAVGDVDSGGPVIYSGSPLYPSLYYTPIGTTNVRTINGPGIRGAFANNTSQGFIIGNTACRTDTSSWIGGSSGDIMEWRAYLHDMTIT